MPSASMYPTIALGTGITADVSVKTPQRGDVFVFDYPENPKQSFVKRIVAVAGDRVEVKGHVLSINGVALPTCAIGVQSYTDDEGTVHKGDLLLESNGSVRYLVFYDGGTGFDGSWTVKPGESFAMGDNRNNSHDSRVWFGGMGGGVPSALLRGKVELGKVALPKDAAALEPALAKCMAR
jgi:signal peptidase I